MILPPLELQGSSQLLTDHYCIFLNHLGVIARFSLLKKEQSYDYNFPQEIETPSGENVALLGDNVTTPGTVCSHGRMRL